MKRISVFAVLVLVQTVLMDVASAGSLNAIINGRSHHVGASQDWNESNVGFGAEYQFDSMSRWKTSAMANGFRDSNDEMSYMAGGSLHRRLFESASLGGVYVDAGITAFFMTRQDVNNNRPFPGLLPSLSLGNRYGGINVAYMPGAGIQAMTGSSMEDPSLKGIVYLQLKIRLDRFLPGAD